MDRERSDVSRAINATYIARSWLFSALKAAGKLLESTPVSTQSAIGAAIWHVFLWLIIFPSLTRNWDKGHTDASLRRSSIQICESQGKKTKNLRYKGLRSRIRCGFGIALSVRSLFASWFARFQRRRTEIELEGGFTRESPENRRFVRQFRRRWSCERPHYSALFFRGCDLLK